VPGPRPATPPQPAGPGPRYRSAALTNTTAGILLATVNSSIVIIAMPDIFRGIGLDPLDPGNHALSCSGRKRGRRADHDSVMPAGKLPLIRCP
jgi:hypothetical protein